MISRAALLAAYDAAHKGPPGGARKLIEEAPGGDGWISVKDRLPEERENWITRDWQHVICCCDFGGDPRRIDVRTYGFGRGHFWHGPQIMDGVVTHWMPLPEPPEAGERGGVE